MIYTIINYYVGGFNMNNMVVISICLNVFQKWYEILNKPYGKIVLFGGIIMLIGSLFFSKKNK